MTPVIADYYLQLTYFPLTEALDKQLRIQISDNKLIPFR